MTWYIVCILIGLLIIGFIIKITHIITIQNENEFLSTYFNEFGAYLNNFISIDFASILKNDGAKNPQKEAEIYSYLIRNSSKAQRILGANGYLEAYQFGNYVVKNYQLIANAVNKLRFPDISIQEFQLVQNMIAIIITEKEELEEKLRNELKNPFSLLREGINFIVTIPISILYWSGLMKYRTFNSLTNNWFIKFVNGIIILIGLIGSIITILLGWEDTIKLFSHFFHI